MSNPPLITVWNSLESVMLGIVRADRVDPLFASTEFDSAIAALLDQRRRDLSPTADSVRRSARDMLRNGTYKPTGRGKPASEYLLRAALEPGTYPRINWPVDVCNYISLSSLLPISIWDLDRCEGTEFQFRLGRSGENYVFNAAGQTISLVDLVVGCETVAEMADGIPIVNPVKDSMGTKTSDGTRRVAACIYAPLSYPKENLSKWCLLFGDWLLQSGGPSATAGHCLVGPGQVETC